MGPHQTKKYLHSKGNNKIKRQPTEWENIFTDTSEKVLKFQSYRELTQLNTKSPSNSIKIWAKTWIDTFPEGTRRAAGVAWRGGRMVLHSHVGGKNQAKFLGSEGSHPQPDHPEAQVSSASKISTHNFWLVKPVVVWVADETAGLSGDSS